MSESVASAEPGAFDPLSAPIDDPAFAELRRSCPVSRAPGGAWYLARYDDAVAGTKDVERFVASFREPGVIVPDEEERAFVNRTIYEELSVGLATAEARRTFVEICERHARDDGADGVILGCTEIPLLLGEGDVSVPTIDTTQVHAEAIFAAALAD